jgi:hypothetical protein
VRNLLVLGGGGGVLGINFMKRRRASSNYDTYNSLKVILFMFKGLPFKVTITLFAVKKCWHKKLQRQKGPV